MYTYIRMLQVCNMGPCDIVCKMMREDSNRMCRSELWKNGLISNCSALQLVPIARGFCSSSPILRSVVVNEDFCNITMITYTNTHVSIFHLSFYNISHTYRIPVFLSCSLVEYLNTKILKLVAVSVCLLSGGLVWERWQLVAPII